MVSNVVLIRVTEVEDLFAPLRQTLGQERAVGGDHRPLHRGVGHHVGLHVLVVALVLVHLRLEADQHCSDVVGAVLQLVLA